MASTERRRTITMYDTMRLSAFFPFVISFSYTYLDFHASGMLGPECPHNNSRALNTRTNTFLSLSPISPAVSRLIFIQIHTLMARLPPSLQPIIIPRQRRRKPSPHCQQRGTPERRVPHIHYASSQMPIHRRLHRLHGQHRHHAHTRGGLCRSRKRHTVTAEAEEQRLEEQRSCYSGRHCVP